MNLDIRFDFQRRERIGLLEEEQKGLEAAKTDNQPKAAKKSCGCC